MNLIVSIPDEIVERLGASGADLERQALEALVLEKYRAGLLSRDELARALGLRGGDQIDRFLKARDMFERCTLEDVDRDVATLERLGY